MSADFEAVARALVPFIPESRDLLAATRAVMNAETDPLEVLRSQGSPADRGWEYPHGALVTFTTTHEPTMLFVRAGQKINAIKELRAATECGLKAAKDAVEAVGTFPDYR